MATLDIKFEGGTNTERLQTVIGEREIWTNSDDGLVFTGDGITLGGKPAYKVTSESGTITQILEDIVILAGETVSVNHILSAQPKQITSFENDNESVKSFVAPNMNLVNASLDDESITALITASDRNLDMTYAKAGTVDFKVEYLQGEGNFLDRTNYAICDVDRNETILKNINTVVYGSYHITYFFHNKNKGLIYLYVAHHGSTSSGVNTQVNNIKVMVFDIKTRSIIDEFRTCSIFNQDNIITNLETSSTADTGGYTKTILFIEKYESNSIGLVGKNLYGGSVELVKYDFNAHKRISTFNNQILNGTQIKGIYENNGNMYLNLTKGYLMYCYLVNLDTNSLKLLTTLRIDSLTLTQIFKTSMSFFDDGSFSISSGNHVKYYGIDGTYQVDFTDNYLLNSVIETKTFIFNGYKYVLGWGHDSHIVNLYKIENESSTTHVINNQAINTGNADFGTICNIYEADYDFGGGIVTATYIEFFRLDITSGILSMATQFILNADNTYVFNIEKAIFLSDSGDGLSLTRAMIIEYTSNAFAITAGVATHSSMIDGTLWNQIIELTFSGNDSGKTLNIQFIGNDGTANLDSPYNTAIDLNTDLNTNIQGIDLVKTYTISTGLAGETWQLALDGTSFMETAVVWDTDVDITTTKVLYEINANSGDSAWAKQVNAYSDASGVITIVFPHYHGIESVNVLNITNTGTGGGATANITSGKTALLDTIKNQNGDKIFNFKVNIQTDDIEVSPIFKSLNFKIENDTMKKQVNPFEVEILSNDTKLEITNKTNETKTITVNISK